VGTRPKSPRIDLTQPHSRAYLTITISGENIAIGLFKEKFVRMIIEEDNDLKGAMFQAAGY